MKKMKKMKHQLKTLPVKKGAHKVLKKMMKKMMKKFAMKAVKKLMKKQQRKKKSRKAIQGHAAKKAFKKLMRKVAKKAMKAATSKTSATVHIYAHRIHGTTHAIKMVPKEVEQKQIYATTQHVKAQMKQQAGRMAAHIAKAMFKRYMTKKA